MVGEEHRKPELVRFVEDPVTECQGRRTHDPNSAHSTIRDLTFS